MGGGDLPFTIHVGRERECVGQTGEGGSLGSMLPLIRVLADWGRRVPGFGDFLCSPFFFLWDGVI